MTRFYIEGAEEFDRACRLLDKRDVPYDIDGGDRIMVADCYAIQVIWGVRVVRHRLRGGMSMLRLNKISPKKPCPFCGAFLENEAPSTIWCHPQNSCLLSLRGITGDDQIAQWDTRFDAKGKKVLDDAE